MVRLKLLEPHRKKLPRIKRYGLDCDGTCTDGDAERPHYIEAFRKNLYEILQNKEDWDTKWENAERKVAANLSNEGWIINGENVAPAHTDGIIFCRAIGGKIILADKIQNNRGEPVIAKEIEDALYELYKRSYAEVVEKTVFRKGLVGFLHYLVKNSERMPFILTNSGTLAVVQKFDLLRKDNPDLPNIPIHGDAHKFVLEDDLVDIPESIKLPSGAEVFLRRARYISKLRELFEGADPKETAYIGDSLHLDGAGALATGRVFFFVPNKETPKEEIGYVLDHPRGFVLESLELG